MNNIIFMVHTEYHVILTIGIIKKYYNDTNSNSITIYQLSPIGTKRLRSINNKLSCAKFVQKFYDTHNVKSFLDEIIELSPNIFFFFLESNYWQNYLLKHLSKKKCRIILAPDGMKVYLDRITPRFSYLKRYVKAFLLCFRTSLFPSLPFVEKYYATSRYIDEVWVEEPELYRNRTHKNVIKFSMPNISDNFVSELNAAFRFDPQKEIKMQNCILYLDFPSSNEIYYERTVQILKTIQLKYKRKVYIKLHPHSKPLSKDYFNNIPEVQYLPSSKPVELYIVNASNVIVLSVVSTGMLFCNTYCKYYWLYPLYKDMLNNNHIQNPTKHIITVTDVSEI